MIDEEGARAEDRSELPLVVLETSSSSTISSLLQALCEPSSRKNKSGNGVIGTITFTASGVRISVEHAKSLQARAFVKKEFLEKYELAEVDIELTVNIATLYHCLTVFGDSSDSSMLLKYSGYGHPLAITISDNGVVTECLLEGMDVEAEPDFSFRDVPVINRISISSQALKAALIEMDLPGATSVELSMSPNVPQLKWEASGDGLACTVAFPNDGNILSICACQRTLAMRYSMPLLRLSFRALAMADVTNIKMNANGMLLMQHMVMASDKSMAKNWVEFVVCPDVEEHDLQ